MDRGIRGFAVVVAFGLVLGSTGFGNRMAAQDSGEGFRLGAVATACEQVPPSGPFVGGGCVPVPGGSVTYSTTDGELIASCVTEASPTPDVPYASCVVELPFGITVVAAADASAFPEGYVLISPNPQTWPIPDGPPEGEFGGPVFMALPIGEQTGAAQPVSTEEAPTAPTPAPQETTEDAVVGRPVHVHPGACDDLDREPRYDLTELTVPNALAEGARLAAVAEASYTVIGVSLDSLLGSESAINAHASHEEIGTYVACGEIGGPRRADGSVVVGLREQDGSGLTGIAYLVPDPGDPGRTQVSLFLAEDLAEEDREPTGRTSP